MVSDSQDAEIMQRRNIEVLIRKYEEKDGNIWLQHGLIYMDQNCYKDVIYHSWRRTKSGFSYRDGFMTTHKQKQWRIKIK